MGLVGESLNSFAVEDNIPIVVELVKGLVRQLEVLLSGVRSALIRRHPIDKIDDLIVVNALEQKADGHDLTFVTHSPLREDLTDGLLSRHVFLPSDGKVRKSDLDTSETTP